jgi:hypothetical protein
MIYLARLIKLNVKTFNMKFYSIAILVFFVVLNCKALIKFVKFTLKGKFYCSK